MLYFTSEFITTCEHFQINRFRIKKCCVSDFKINEQAYYKLKTLIEQRRSFFILRQKLASFVNGNENEASAALFLKHERSFATGFLSGLSYKKSCQEKVEFHNSLISQLGEIKIFFRF